MTTTEYEYVLVVIFGSVCGGSLVSSITHYVKGDISRATFWAVFVVVAVSLFGFITASETRP